MTDTATVETPVHDTTKTPVGIAPREGVTVVDNTNFGDFVDSQLPPAPKAEESEEVGGDKNVTAPKSESATTIVEPKEGDTNADGDMFLHGKWQDKRSFAYRLHMGTQEKVKESEAKASKAEAEAKDAREKLAQTERERNDLRNKYEPPKSDEIGPEPLPDQFTHINEYRKAIKDWASDAAIKEERANNARQAVAKSWEDRQAAVKKEIPDYADKIASSDVKVSDQLRDAIVESDLGPKILYHLAENPDIAASLGNMTVGRMLREFGKLEAKMGGAEKPLTKSDEKPPTATVAEISKAPAPITPLRGASAPVSSGIDAKGEFHGTYEEYKAKRLAGKIK